MCDTVQTNRAGAIDTCAKSARAAMSTLSTASVLGFSDVPPARRNGRAAGRVEWRDIELPDIELPDIE
jgi:hypothetical protein